MLHITGIDDVTMSLNDLNTATLRSAVEFRGFTKTITSAAAGTEGASKAWTTFSRLVSGTPLWAFQNKLRAYLSILAGFENRSQANIKAMKEEDKLFVKRVKGTKKVIEEFELMNQIMNESITITMLSKVSHEQALEAQVSSGRVTQENMDTITEAITDTKEYALAITAGASEQMAMAAGTVQLNKRMKEFRIQDKAITRAAKEAYAFDEKRIKTRKVLAGKKAEAEGKGYFGRKFAVRKAGKKEKAQMDKEQTTIMSKLAGEKGDDAIKTIGDELGMMIKGIGAPLFAMHKLAKSRRKMQIKILKFTNSLKGVLDIAFRYFMFGVFAVIGFMALIPVFFAIKDMIKPFAGDIKHYGGRLIEFGKDIFGVIKAFADGGIDEGIKQLGPLFDTGLQLLIDFGQGLLVIGQALLFRLIDMAIEFVYKFFTDEEFRKPIIDRLLQIAKIVLAVWFIKTLAANAIQLIGIYLLPAMIGIVILAVIYRAWKFLVQKSVELASKQLTAFIEYIRKIGDYIYAVAEGSMKFMKFIRDGWNDLMDSLDFDLLHTGGVATGGATIVGERGPELLNLPKGSRVYNNQQTKSMAGRGAGNVVNNYITINARDTSDAELRRIADRIGSMVNSKINRTTSSRTLG